MANTIVLRGDLARYHGEAVASGASKPGHRVMLDSDGKALKATSPNHPLYIAKEDALQGNTITNTYAIGDIVPYHMAQKADKVQVRVPAYCPAITKGDRLIDNGTGDGTFIKCPTSVPLLYSAVARSTSITNTNTETAFSLSYTIPAYLLAVGDVVKISGQGIATSTNSTDTLQVKVKIGSNAIYTSGAIDAANDDIFTFRAEATIRTVGTTGTMVGSGVGFIGTQAAAAGAADIPGGGYGASATINTTTTNAVTVTATWSVASTSNIVYLDQLNVELVRANGVRPVFQADESVDNSAGTDEAFIDAVVI